MASDARSFSLGGAAAVIVPAGVACAAADISYVIVLVLVKGGNPFRMLQGIAFSVLGRPTYEGGVATAALGLAIHTCVALGAAALFFALYRSLAIVRAHWLASGVLFGAGFYVLMQLVVLPLTRIPHQPFPPPNWVPIFIAHVTVIGPLIAAVTQWRCRR